MRFSPLAGDGAPEAGAEGTRREGSCGSRAKRGLAPKLFEEMRFIAIVVIVLILSLGLIVIGIMITTMLSSINIIMIMIIKHYDYDDDHHDYSYYYYDSYDNYYYCFYLLITWTPGAFRILGSEGFGARANPCGSESSNNGVYILGFRVWHIVPGIEPSWSSWSGGGGGKIAKQSWSSCPNLPQLLAD